MVILVTFVFEDIDRDAASCWRLCHSMGLACGKWGSLHEWVHVRTDGVVLSSSWYPTPNWASQDTKTPRLGLA